MEKGKELQTIDTSKSSDACKNHGGFSCYICDQIFNKACALECPGYQRIGSECADGSFDRSSGLNSCPGIGIRCYYCYQATAVRISFKIKSISPEYKLYDFSGIQIKGTLKRGIYIKRNRDISEIIYIPR
jgi:hypothetical protein